jgi:hypothetical protein
MIKNELFQKLYLEENRLKYVMEERQKLIDEIELNIKNIKKEIENVKEEKNEYPYLKCKLILGPSCVNFLIIII